MITCQHARQLFDRYLDGELSPSLQAELHAHQLSCSACQTELAMLEACGDVIMLDHRREPKLSDSFTDRVLMARRTQLAKQRKSRNWGRTILLVGSPMAAAASILLALTLMWPSTQRPDRVASSVVVKDPVSQKLLMFGSGADGSSAPQPGAEVIPPGFVDVFLGAVIDRASQTVNGAQSNLLHLNLLLDQALADTNAKLAAQEQANPRRLTSPDRGADRSVGDPDLLAPPSLGPDSTNDSASDPLMDPL